MKQKILTTVLIVGLLFSITIPVLAITNTFTKIQVDKNKIQLSLQLSDGYITAYRVSVKLTGNVVLTGIEWPSSSKESYTRKYYYQKETNQIDFYVATGNKENLVDSKQNLEIATLILAPKEENKNEPYQVSLNPNSVLEIMTSNYQSKKITDIRNNSEDSFSFDTILKPTPTPTTTPEPTLPPTSQPEQPEKPSTLPPVATENPNPSEVGQNQDNPLSSGGNNQQEISTNQKKPSSSEEGNLPKETPKQSTSTTPKEASWWESFQSKTDSQIIKYIFLGVCTIVVGVVILSDGPKKRKK